jgi:hypothetical protein
MACCGTYQVESDRVVHRNENSLFPEWIATDLARTSMLEADHQRVVGDAGGRTQHLLWKRVPRSTPWSN